MDGFFTEIPSNEKIDTDRQKSYKKIKAPSVLGDEQRKMYKEMKEINDLAPERNDMQYMDHLCKFWLEREKEEIQEKRFTTEIFEHNLERELTKDKEDQRMDHKQRRQL